MIGTNAPAVRAVGAGRVACTSVPATAAATKQVIASSGCVRRRASTATAALPSSPTAIQPGRPQPRQTASPAAAVTSAAGTSAPTTRPVRGPDMAGR